MELLVGPGSGWREVMKKVVNLKDGTEVTIRPMRNDDLERSYEFFRELPEEDRKYLRRDVTNLQVVRHRIRSMRAEKVKRLVVTHEDAIVADGALEFEGKGWDRDAVELRLIVSQPFQRKGLGMRMARELYLLAAKKRVEEIVVRMMQPQIAARRIFERLGFFEDTELRDTMMNLGGERKDLIVMRCNLKSIWIKLEDYFTDTDWQRTR